MSLRWVLALVIALAFADPAAAAKWKGGCPKTNQKLSIVGLKGAGGTPYALSRFFEHVGHDVTFYLKDHDVQTSGGFSTDPDGNTVQVTFTPINGDPIALPPIAVTATTPATLTFTMPDSRTSARPSARGPRGDHRQARQRDALHRESPNDPAADERRPGARQPGLLGRGVRRHGPRRPSVDPARLQRLRAERRESARNARRS